MSDGLLESERKKSLGSGVDAIAPAPDGRTVQIKATAKNFGPNFRPLEKEKRADHLLFLVLDLDERTVEIVFNGPEKIALKDLLAKPDWKSQMQIPLEEIRNAAERVPTSEKLVSKINPLTPKR